MPRLRFFMLSALLTAACAPRYDVVIRHGTIYDGSGNDPLVGDLAIEGDTIAAVGAVTGRGRVEIDASGLAASPLPPPPRGGGGTPAVGAVTGRGRVEIDASGLAVSPGFINMLSHSEETLIQDPRSQGEIRQGVTLEVFGEGSMGPLSDAMKQEALEQQGDIKYPIEWTTLGEYFDFLERRGIATNVASFVGASTARVHVIGYQNRAPTPAELDRMKELVARAMDEGALGVTTALIYTPATFAKTDELIALAKVAAEAGGGYAAHIRSEGDRFLQAIHETIPIASDAGLPAEIYHLKAAGNANWPKMDRAIQKIDSARAAGFRITADLYTQ